MSSAVERRRRVVVAGHRADEATARDGLDDDEGRVRASAHAALARMDRWSADDRTAARRDADVDVRRRAAELAAACGDEHLALALLGDDDPLVIEVAAWALGETGSSDPSGVARLVELATGHDDPLCRESAVAALGALGDPAGRAAVLGATRDRPAVRRRAVIALAAFDGPDVEAALERASEDRDWQVRQIAEDLLDPNPDDT